jgi:hypothetical protein
MQLSFRQHRWRSERGEVSSWLIVAAALAAAAVLASSVLGDVTNQLAANVETAALSGEQPSLAGTGGTPEGAGGDGSAGAPSDTGDGSADGADGALSAPADAAEVPVAVPEPGDPDFVGPPEPLPQPGDPDFIGPPEPLPQPGDPDFIGPPQPEPRADLHSILTDYQVTEDVIVDWKPQLGGIPVPAFWMDPRQILSKEADLLDELAFRRGVLGLNTFQGIVEDAYATSQVRYPLVATNPRAGDDDHTDAFRHAYASGRLVYEFGPEFATAITEAHEGHPMNDAPEREAMDLYNNSIGIQIALDNPDATPEEFADLIDDAVRNGDLVVVDLGGNLDYSDNVPVGAAGHPARTGGLPGRDPADWDPS